jgi:hypothetical protein
VSSSLIISLETSLISPIVFSALSSFYTRPNKESGLEVGSINSSFINIDSFGSLLNYKRAPPFLLLISNLISLSSKPRISTSSYKSIHRLKTLICFYSLNTIVISLNISALTVFLPIRLFFASFNYFKSISQLLITLLNILISSIN